MEDLNHIIGIGLVEKEINDAVAIQGPKLKKGQTLKIDINTVDGELIVNSYPVNNRGE